MKKDPVILYGGNQKNNTNAIQSINQQMLVKFSGQKYIYLINIPCEFEFIILSFIEIFQ